MTEKRFNVFDVDGTVFLEDHEEGSYHIGEIGNVDVNCLNDIAYRLNELHEESKQLKKSVKRQQKSNEECSKYIEEVVQENKKLKEKLEYGQCHMCGARLKYGGIEMNKELFE